MKRLLYIGISFSLSVLAASAADPTIKSIIKEGTENPQAMQHVDVLTGRFGGRLVGSAAYENAAQWLKYKFDGWGIPVRFEEAGQVPVGFNRDAWRGRAYGVDGLDHLHFATPSYTSGTHGCQRGHVVNEPRSRAEFNRMRGRLKGAWVLLHGFSNGMPIDKSAYGDSVRLSAQEKNDSLRALDKTPAMFYRQMCDAGVLGFIQAAETPIRALYDRKLLADSTLTFDNLPTQPEIKLDCHQFDLIKRAVDERRDIMLEFDIRNHFSLGPVKYSNVIAEIRGTKYPDEYVIISGHLDAYDVGTGAIDCGTGIGPMLEAARLIALSGANPKRTIRFVAFAGEEFGLLGAQAYCKQHKAELPKISLMLNRDGGPEPPVAITVPEGMYDDMCDICKPLAAINESYGFEVRKASPRKRPTKYGGNDATVFAVEGVPTCGFNLKDVEGVDFRYGEIWHTENDILNKQVPQYLQHTSIVTAIVALGVANLDHQLSRKGMFVKDEQAQDKPAE